MLKQKMQKLTKFAMKGILVQNLVYMKTKQNFELTN